MLPKTEIHIVMTESDENLGLGLGQAYNMTGLNWLMGIPPYSLELLHYPFT